MGLGARADIAARLLERRWPAATPAAILLAAGTPRAFTWIGRLGELGAAALPGGGDAGTIVVGAVASLGRATGVAAGASPHPLPRSAAAAALTF
jgi:siroheme synthase